MANFETIKRIRSLLMSRYLNGSNHKLQKSASVEIPGSLIRESHGRVNLFQVDFFLASWSSRNIGSYLSEQDVGTNNGAVSFIYVQFDRVQFINWERGRNIIWSPGTLVGIASLLYQWELATFWTCSPLNASLSGARAFLKRKPMHLWCKFVILTVFEICHIHIQFNAVQKKRVLFL